MADATCDGSGVLPCERCNGTGMLLFPACNFATVDLHNLFHFLKLRLHPHAQYEIRVYAEAILQLIRPIAPACVAAWEESNGVRS